MSNGMSKEQFIKALDGAQKKIEELEKRPSNDGLIAEIEALKERIKGLEKLKDSDEDWDWTWE